MQSIKQSDTQPGLEGNTSNWAGASATALGIHLCDFGKFYISTLWGISQTLIIMEELERFYFFPKRVI